MKAELIDFTIERQRHRRFVGREDVLARLDEWLLVPGEAGWVVVTGGPGMGKSALLAAWLARREHTDGPRSTLRRAWRRIIRGRPARHNAVGVGAVVAHHFVRRQVANWDQPEAISASLAAQIEAAFPRLRDPGAKPEGRLIELLGRLSKQVGPSGNLVVLIDGLDETHAEPGDNPLPRFLPHEVPAGIRILCAMRPAYPHLNWIEARSPARRIDLDDGQWAESNEAVVCGFWEAVATEYKPPLPVETRIAAIERAEGNVLHAVMLHDTLRELSAQERHADRIPRGLRALIGNIWHRAASDESVRLGLGLLCAAQEALSLDVLTDLAGWSYHARDQFVSSARQLLLEEPASWTGALAYRPRHDWVRELMVERLGASTILAHHKTLVGKLATWPVPAGATALPYALRHALTHRAAAGEWADAWRLAADMSFVETKCRELGAHDVEADLARVAERCRVSGDETLRGRFTDLARALGRESHWLRDAPEATTALLWNRLRQLGWSSDEIDQQLQVPAGAIFLRVRHLATRESPALVRDLVGHTSDVSACAVIADGRCVVSASADKTLKVWDLASGRTVATLEGHADRVLACAVTPDGRCVVSASADKTLKVWDLASGRTVATLEGHANRVLACAVTPDGRCVVSASADKTLKVWDLASGRTVAILEGHANRVLACAVTADGRCVVSASADKTLKVWDLATGRTVTTLESHTDWVLACAVTPDGRRVVSASKDRTLKVWDTEKGCVLVALKGHARSVVACAVTANGKHVISASNDHTLKVWDLDSGRAIATLEGHAGDVNACAVTADGKRAISASNDRTLKVWNLESGRALPTPEGHIRPLLACAVTPDSRHMVSTSYDGTLKLWDLESGRTLTTLDNYAHLGSACAVTAGGTYAVLAPTDGTLKLWGLKSESMLVTSDYGWTDEQQQMVRETEKDTTSLNTPRVRPEALRRAVAGVSACAVMPDGRVVSASDDHTLTIWDLKSGRPVATLKGHTDWVRACAATPNGHRVVSASDDHTLTVWDLKFGRPVSILEGHADWVRACAVTPDGRRVVSASDDHTLTVWDFESGCPVATLAGHTDWVRACAVTPDGRRVVSASTDKTLKVWDLESGRTVATLEGHDDKVLACAVTPDGRRVVSASADKTLKIWDLESGRAVATLEGHDDLVLACTATPDGRRAVSASADKTLKVWDLASGRTVATLKGHDDKVLACAVTPDGRRVVSASADKTLKVWDLEYKYVVATLEGHDDWVFACAVTPDGRRVVSASADKTLKVWDLEYKYVVATLEGHDDWVFACAVTPDGRRVVSASADKTLKVWDLKSECTVTTPNSRADRVLACAVTPDGRRVVSASADKTLKVWDLEFGRTILAGHTDRVLACTVTPDGRRVISASADKTLKVWDLESGRIVATLEGHAADVLACAVTPDGSRVVSASADQTLKVWSLDSHTCLLTHRANAAYTAVAVTASAIIAGDATGSVWFLEWPSPNRRERSHHVDRDRDNQRSSPSTDPHSQKPPMTKHTILFLAASPNEGGHAALEQEARAIQKELESTGHRDRFDFETRWAVEPLDLLRELRKLKPTVVHFTGRGGQSTTGGTGTAGSEQPGLFFQAPDGSAQAVSAEAIAQTFGAAGSSVKLVVLNACYSDAQAKALLSHVDCVVGMSGSIHKDAARTFAIGFYGGLGEREPVAAAYEQGCAAIGLQGVAGGDRPQLKVRAGADAGRLVLAADPDPQ